MVKILHRDEYNTLWNDMDINNDKIDDFQKAAQKILKGIVVYKRLEEKTKVPWRLIGLIHYRESNCNFSAHLHNGDPLYEKTINEPKGRPLTGIAPYSFEFSAIDALTIDGLTNIDDWDIETISYFLEKYNGFGYRLRGVNSPYLWAGTSNYTKGKYTSDKVYNPKVIDKQLGAMGILKTLMDMDQEPPIVALPQEEKSIKAVPTKVDQKEVARASKKWHILDWLTGLFTATFATIASYLTDFVHGVAKLTMSDVQSARAYVDQLKEIAMKYGPWAGLILAILGFFAVTRIKQHMKEDVSAGRYTPSGMTTEAEK